MLKNLAGIFEGLPPVKEEYLPPLLNPNQGQCVHCKCFLPLKDMPILNSGVVMAQEPLCKECKKIFSDQARIICITCHVVILWVDPHKEKSGFEFVKNKAYHVKNCPKCKPGLERTQVLEKIIYFEENNMPYEK